MTASDFDRDHDVIFLADIREESIYVAIQLCLPGAVDLSHGARCEAHFLRSAVQFRTTVIDGGVVPSIGAFIRNRCPSAAGT